MGDENTGTAEMQKAMSTIDRLEIFDAKLNRLHEEMVLQRGILMGLRALIVEHHGNTAPPLSLSGSE